MHDKEIKFIYHLTSDFRLLNINGTHILRQILNTINAMSPIEVKNYTGPGLELEFTQ